MSGVIDKGCPSDHPMLVNTIAEMARKGHSKETIMRITGADAAMVDSHMIGAERQAGGRSKMEKPARTDAEQQAINEKMAKMRAGRGRGRPPKATPAAE